MCGRYYTDKDDAEMQEIYRETLRNMVPEHMPLLKAGGEIFPTHVVPIRTKDRYEPMKWGFAKFEGKGQIINAKSETALCKPMFAKAMRERRCLVPVSGYYEWKKEEGKKIKHTFFHTDNPLLFLAGCYRMEKNSPFPVFVILTRDAPPPLMEIHDRMPVVIPTHLVHDWLNNSPDVMYDSLTNLQVNVV